MNKLFVLTLVVTIACCIMYSIVLTKCISGEMHWAYAIWFGILTAWSGHTCGRAWEMSKWEV